MNKFRLVRAAAIIGICFVSVATSPQHAFAQAPNVAIESDVTGVWKGERIHVLVFSTGVKTLEVSFDLQQSGDKIVGTARWGLSPYDLCGTGGPLQAINTNLRSMN